MGHERLAVGRESDVHASRAVIRRVGIALAVILWLGAMFALGLSAQERQATWIVGAAEVAHVDSLRAAVAVMGGASDRPDPSFYRVRGPYRGLRDSLFVYADSNRDAPVGRRTAVTGPWKRWVRFVELDGLTEVPRDSTPDGAAPLEAASWPQVLHGSDVACTWFGACGQGTTGAGADTGVDRFHPEFAGKLLWGKNVTGATLGGPPVDSLDFSDTVAGCNGHGTHTASSLAGRTVAMARDASLVAYRVFAPNPNGCLSYTSAGTLAILDATRNGLDAINESIGYNSSAAMGSAVTAARNAGMVVCGSNGNTGAPGVYAPALFADAIASAAVDGVGSRAPFSTTGPETDFGTAGVNVRGALPGGAYGDKSGTSMGSPFTCSLFLQLFSTPEFRAMPRTRAKVDSAQTLMCASAERRPAGGRDSNIGCGTPNVARAIAMMRGGILPAAKLIDTMMTAAAVTVCKAIVWTTPWKATTNTPWVTLSSTQNEVCYTTIPALMPVGGGAAVVRVEPAGVSEPPPITGPTVTVDLGVRYQTMTGWEATAQAGQAEPQFLTWQGETLDSGVAIGINRLRVELHSGAENPVDAYARFRAGQITSAQWNAARYVWVNDNADPLSANTAGFSWAKLDEAMNSVVVPMRTRLAARGDALYLSLNYVSFGNSTAHADPAEWAELLVVAFQHLQARFGFVPDAIEVILEPDNNAGTWTGAAIGRAIAAAGPRLAAAGFHPEFIAPSVTNMGNTVSYLNAMVAVPGVLTYLKEVSYHRYQGYSVANLQGIATRAKALGLRTSMLEHIASGVDDLLEDVTVGNASAWQQYTLAYPTSDNGAQYFTISGGRPVIGGMTRLLAPVFSAVKRGAVRVGSQGTDHITAAFVNPDGRAVVVLRPRAAGSVTLVGLPTGRYQVTFAPESGATTASTVNINGPAPLAISGAGVMVVRGVP